mmetsp:Transcript_32093/g.52335  ORF Transcript_32093/g.52335 Transcript_32093/m.52335 type:complete len:483 (-) Transcript_32093:165-1613(-)
MFTRMLRPSRRHAHERISQHSQHEDANDSNNNGDSNHATDNATVDQQSDPAIVGIGGGENGIVVIGNLTEVAADGGGDDETSQLTSAAGSNMNASNQDNSIINNNNNNNNEQLEINENQNNENLQQSSSDEADEEEGTLHPNPTTHPFLTSQIQTERELRYRRQSTCTLLILFFLIRLWIEAILKKDVGLIFLSMMGTMWTYRWFMSRREAEEEYDRQIMEERNSSGEPSTTNEVGTGTGADAAVNFDPDLGLMSFQAQLALAILESQRQMFENGGYGGNDRSADEGPGVTNEAKERWKSYEWGDNAEETAKLAGLTRSSSMAAIKRTTSNESNYGSVSTTLSEDEDNYDESLDKASKLEGGLLMKSFDDEEPSCSICLCEYEHAEKVLRLPCDHIYHESCLNSWTANHFRCPLCNYDLMEGFEQPASVQRAQQHAEEQRAFRHMALSTLGRRMRSRRSMSRRTSRASTAAALVAAADDSIV